jgi:hypothetical protein
MKTIVAGGRDFSGYAFVAEHLDSKDTISEIVCGLAPGVDTLGEQWALAMGVSIKRFPADWDQYGNDAGYIRNAEMAAYADCLIAFWDGRSTGTHDMIKLAREYGIPVEIVSI